MRKMILMPILMVLAVSAGTMFLISRNSDTRATYARSLSEDELDIHASGHLNTTLNVTMLSGDPDHDHLRCDLFVGEVISDKKLSRELREKGFMSIQCGAIKAQLP